MARPRLNHVAAATRQPVPAIQQGSACELEHAFVSVIPVNSFHGHQIDLTLEVVSEPMPTGLAPGCGTRRA